MNKKHSGVFITIEGGEGAGKTTLIRRLEQALVALDYKLLVTREPGDTELGKQIRSTLLHSGSVVDPLAETLLFLADRAQHIHEALRPSLQSGVMVLCDRFNDSTIAYQGVGRGLGLDFVQNWCHSICGDILPDLTLLLDLDPAKGLTRVKIERNTLDSIEAEDLTFHKKIREAFLLLAKRDPARFEIIDASASLDEVFENSLQAILKRMLSYGQCHV